MLISIKEYAIENGKKTVTVRQKCQRGNFKTSKKIGNSWVIDSEEPYSDLRIKKELKNKVKCTAIITNNSNTYEYEVNTTSALKVSQMYGKASGGEIITVYRNKKAISQVKFCEEEGGYYYRCNL